MKQFLKSAFTEIIKLLFIYAFSGGLYLLIETLYRGRTYLEMFYLAGFLGILAMLANNFMSYNLDYIIQCLIMTIIGTLGEGTTGILFNSDFHIWDYCGLWGTFFCNQCNIMFVGVWFVLFFILIPVLDFVEWDIFDYMPDTPPYYMIFGHKISPFENHKRKYLTHILSENLVSKEIKTIMGNGEKENKG